MTDQDRSGSGPGADRPDRPAPPAEVRRGVPEVAHPDEAALAADDSSYLGEPGPPLDHRAPFFAGFVGATGALLAYWLLVNLRTVAGSVELIVVAMFIAAGLNPAVRWLERRGLKRGLAVLVVIVAVVLAVVLFLVTLVPVIADQVASITKQAPHWLSELQQNSRIKKLDEDYDVIGRIRDYVTGGDFVSTIFGGAVGIGLAVLGGLFNGFIVLVLTLYFLASFEAIKKALYRLAPASRRDRVSRLGERVFDSIGGYVLGAFVVALCAGISTLVFAFVVGLGQYAVALAFVVALLDVIPMIGATIGAVIVTAIGFADDWRVGVACIVFYVAYQQIENYLIYPRVMSRSVDVPGAVTVIAALIGAGLLGVVGALMAIPTAASLLLLTREVYVRRQDAR